MGKRSAHAHVSSSAYCGSDVPRDAARETAFAGRRARAFAVVLGSGALLGGVLGVLQACSSGDEPPLQSHDAAPSPPPGACNVTPSSTPFCDAGTVTASPSPSDSGVDGGAEDDAGEAGALAPPASGNTCLVTSDTTIACPSAVAGLTAAQGRGEASDVVITQRRVGHYTEQGFLSNDTHADVQHVHLDGHGGGSATLDPIPPYEYPAETPLKAPLLAALGGGAASDPALVVLSVNDGGTSSLRTEHLVPGSPATLGGPFDLPGAFFPTFATLTSGEGIALLQPRDLDTGSNSGGGFVLVRGLPDAPRSLPTSITADIVALTTDPSGNPAGLFSMAGKPKLLEGDGFTHERWSGDASTDSTASGGFDVVYVGGSPAVLIANRVQVLDTSPPSGAYALLGNSFSTCSRATYVGVTCDACPVDQHCQTGEDDIRAARLFTRDGRLFAIYYSTDVRRTMGFSLDKTPVIGVGCVCAIHERDKQEYADSIVVVELTAPASPGGPPTVVEQMRLPIFKARTTGFVSLLPRTDGDVDVIVGGQLAGSWQSTLTELPKDPTTFRALRVSTRALRR